MDSEGNGGGEMKIDEEGKREVLSKKETRLLSPGFIRKI